ncbi:hypothetical protein AMTRI_Chr07g27850 [Amborella trichopoda]
MNSMIKGPNRFIGRSERNPIGLVVPLAVAGRAPEVHAANRGLACAGPPTNNRFYVPPPQAELVSHVIGDHFVWFRGHLSQPPIFAKFEFVAPTIIEVIPNSFSTSGASVAYNVNPVVDQFQRTFQTIYNYFLVRSFLCFGYEVSLEALDKGAIEILGPYGISYTFRRLAERISQLQSGSFPLPYIPLHSIISYCTDIRGSSEWRFPCRESDEGRPSRLVRRARYPDPTIIMPLQYNRSSFISIVCSFYNKKSR